MNMLWILLLVFLLQGLVSAPGKCRPVKECGTTTRRPTTRTSTTKASTAKTSTNSPPTTAASIATTVSKDSSNDVTSKGTTISPGRPSGTDPVDQSTPPATPGLTSNFPRMEKSEKNQISQIVFISVPVIIIIVATIGGVILCLKRKGFQLSFTRDVCRKKTSTEKHNAGTAMTNTTYENTGASPTEESLTSQSLDSGYAEIPSNPAENPDSVYQTIDGLPENQTVSTNTYGHIKGKDFGVDSNTYSHISANQAVTTPEQGNVNYSHVGTFGTKSHEAVSEANIDSTYNRLDTMSRLDKAKNATEIKYVEDDETEYDHAVAGMAESVSDNKRPSEYGHLITKTQGICTTDRAENRAGMRGNDAESLEMRTIKYSKDIEKPISAKAIVDSPIYSKVNKTSTNTSRCKDASRKPDDEFAVASPHFYFTLERERNIQCDEAVSFRIAENEAADEVSEHEGSNRHDYFILEAQQ